MSVYIIDKKELIINVMGMGYIGLPTATVFADTGFKVYGFDINSEIVDTLNRGEIHIVEPELEEVYKKALFSKKLIPTNTMNFADVHFICVPTPITKDKKADLSYVINAVKMLIPFVKHDNIIVLESTIPPRTTEMVEDILSETGLKPNQDFFVAHCPERVLPGRILYEFQHNDRIIGIKNSKAANLLKELYSLVITKGRIHITDPITAEMCKLVENTYRDINIAFANELSMISNDCIFRLKMSHCSGKREPCLRLN